MFKNIVHQLNQNGDKDVICLGNINYQRNEFNEYR